jgi:hypothetical protein
MSNGYPRGCVMARGIAIVRCANCRLDSEHPSAATCRSMSLARVLRAERDPVHERQRATVPLSIEASTALSAAPSATAASESVDRPAPALAGVPAVAPLPATAPAPAPPELEPAARLPSRCSRPNPTKRRHPRLAASRKKPQPAPARGRRERRRSVQAPFPCLPRARSAAPRLQVCRLGPRPQQPSRTGPGWVSRSRSGRCYGT